MPVNILFWGRDWDKFRMRNQGWDLHPYAQLEVCARGRIAVRVVGGTIELAAGDCLLIPPAVRHGCFYPFPDNEFYSLKFERAQLPKQHLLCRADDFTRWFLTSLRNCHRPEQRLGMPLNDSNREILNGITEMLMAHLLRPIPPPGPDTEPPIFSAIRETVLGLGQYVTVEDCAELLGMDSARLNYRFAKELKAFHLTHDRWSVKKIIDTALLSQINKYLDFTELTISEIAKQMKFNNIYTFSRFYRRLEGC